MLITDDSKGTADGKEFDQLHAMEAVGSEFITYRDHESTVQKSGEFVRITKETGEPMPRFVLLHETSTQYDVDGNDLDGEALLNPAPNLKLRKRSRLYVSEMEAGTDLPFREVGGYSTYARIPRHHGVPLEDDPPNSFSATFEANYTSHAGKRRIFADGSGKAVLVREVHVPGDARWFHDALREQALDGNIKGRGLRAAKVEVSEINLASGKTSVPMLTFDVHSGLGVNETRRDFSAVVRTTSDDMMDSTRIFAAFSGVLHGRSLGTEDSSSVPVGGDASDTYAVSEPARAKTLEGQEYLSVVAVYPAPDDVYNPVSSGPYRLTCKRTTPDGNPATGKINLPTFTFSDKHYHAVRGISLHRTSPSTLMLRVLVHLMQFGAGGTYSPAGGDAYVMWSDDNGASWSAPLKSGVGVSPYGGVLVKDKDTVLFFSWFYGWAAETVQVFHAQRSGAKKISYIPASTFSTGLMDSSHQGSIPYLPFGFGGATYLTREGGPKKRLWMQFDPYWSYEQDYSWAVSYPNARPMLMVSDDGGLTWSRRFLPSVWCFRVGFVVSISQREIAVPVYSPRLGGGKPIAATIYVSKDGGDSWKKTGSSAMLPGESYVDGRIIIGEEYTHPIYGDGLRQDLSDTVKQYSRGELLPMVALRNSDGDLLPANPARPWMNDHNIEEPDYA